VLKSGDPDHDTPGMNRRAQQGFTLIELAIVVLVIGVLASMAMVATGRMARQDDVGEAALIVAGAFKTARERAMQEGTNYLVFFRQEDNCADGRDPILDVVKDVDGSMTVSGPDEVTPVALSGDLGCEVKAFDPDSGVFPGLTLPVEDLAYMAALGLPKLPPVAASGTGSEGEGEGKSGCSSSSTSFSSVTEKGATFAPASGGSGDPVVMFTARGVPVHPDTPTDWGSGAGGYYLTNGEKVLGVLVAPSGKVRVRAYHPETGRWI
jgi:prepilin-type N-terminal cleavage/methylation domain-containing protein